MLLTAQPLERDNSLRLAPNFRSWQRNTVQSGLLPVIAIGGTRGKSTVIRMLDHIYRTAHLRTATWTNLGIEVRGRRQQGELKAWSTALNRMAAGTIDVALQELHWNTVNAVGLPPNSYPLVALTTLWPEEESENMHLLQAAAQGTERMALAVHHTGLLVGSGDDYHMMDVIRHIAPNLMLTARSRELPALITHLKNGGTAIWHEKRQVQELDAAGNLNEHAEEFIHLGDGVTNLELMATSDIPSSLGSRAMFQLANAMTAAAIAYATGINLETIQTALATFVAEPDLLPASFNVHRGKTFTGYVNRLETPGITKSVLRAINRRAKRRQITVVDDLAELSATDCLEIGRMLGRNHGAVLLHSQSDESKVEQMRRGIAADAYPPLVIHFPTERRALNRVFQTLQEGDTLLVLTAGDGRIANRAIERQLEEVLPTTR